MSRAATGAGCGAILLWAFLATLSRGAGALPPFELTAAAFSVSGLAGVALLAARGRLGVLRQSWWAWLHGTGGLFAFHALYFAAIALAPVAVASLLNYVWPLLIVLLSAPLLGMRLTGRHAAGVAIALAGCVVLLGPAARFPAGAWLGCVLAVLSGCAWALYSVLSRRFQAVPSEALAGFCAGTAALAWLAHALTETTVLPSPATALFILALGLGPTGAAFVLWDHGMKRGDPRLLGTLAFGTPVLSTLLLAAFGEAALTPTTLAAALLVTAGGWVAARAGF